MVELQEHLEYLMLFRSEEALSPEIASDHIRPIGARLAEIALLMPRGGTARAAERAPSDALDAAPAPAPTQPVDRLGELEAMVATGLRARSTLNHAVDAFRNTAQCIFSRGLGEADDVGGGSPGFGVVDHTEFALRIARRRIACDSRFAPGVPAARTDIGFGPRQSTAAG